MMKKEVHNRDGCGLNNEFTNLEIITQNQNKISHGNSVTTLYADMNKIYMRFDTQKDACAYFGFALTSIQACLNNKEKQLENNGHFFFFLILVYKFLK
jgi:hypothetical protein